eukprot:scaffold26225_cov61-Attheya_sp.AAC.5
MKGNSYKLGLASHDVVITDENFSNLWKKAKLCIFLRWQKDLGFSVIAHKEGQMSWGCSR